MAHSGMAGQDTNVPLSSVRETLVLQSGAKSAKLTCAGLAEEAWQVGGLRFLLDGTTPPHLSNTDWSSCVQNRS